MFAYTDNTYFAADRIAHTETVRRGEEEDDEYRA